MTVVSGWGVLPACLAALALAAGCSREDGFGEVDPPQTFIETYQVVLEDAPEGDIADVAEDALEVYLRQDDGANSRSFLVQRARGDLETLRRLLRSRGYYEGDATVEITPEAAEAVILTFRLAPGPLYTLAAHRLTLTGRDDAAIQAPGDAAPALDLAQLGSPVGEPALAEPIVAAEDRAVARLRRAGFAYARFRSRDAVADTEAKTIEVTSVIEPGLRYRVGAISFSGVTSVEEAYLRSYVETEPGAVFDGSKLRATQQRLRGTGLFNVVRIARPAEPPSDGVLPLTITVEERLPRTVAAGIRYDTTEGPEVFGRLTHRNLLGENETGTIEATLGQELIEFDAELRKPQFLRDRQVLVARVVARNEDREAFDGPTSIISLGLERSLTPFWTVGLGGAVEFSRITDNRGTKESSFLGVPAFVAYDSTDDLLDPRRGERLRLTATPYTGPSDGMSVSFLMLDIAASTYVPLTRDRNYVLALRGRLGSVQGVAFEDIPANYRVYAGGGESVRGYGRDLIGPIDAFNSPTGGLAVMEVGAELRAEFLPDIGGVLFIEAGSVTQDDTPDFRNGVQVALGLGLRYYSPVGPVRFDVGFPIEARDVDDPFQFYVSIGQAF
ncbi:MAG: BamA/TamA family outer membrane protein [Pseudomonadota bacterium]